jgi:pyridoxal phosphate enzyme (YggS family)
MANLANKFQPTREQLHSNYLQVMDRIDQAAVRSGRLGTNVKMIGVTKYVDASITRWLVELGCQALGESRPQVLWEKAEELSDLPIEWHLIGHLQRNKAKRTLPYVTAMHSLDSTRIFEQIQLDCLSRNKPLQLLLEINVSGDPAKTGMMASDAETMLNAWQLEQKPNSNLEIVGLMGLGSLQGGEEQARRDFTSLRNLRDRWATRFGLPLKELSMGMSDDFEAAIEEGATMVRIGSILFAT